MPMQRSPPQQCGKHSATGGSGKQPALSIGGTSKGVASGSAAGATNSASTLTLNTNGSSVSLLASEGDRATHCQHLAHHHSHHQHLHHHHHQHQHPQAPHHHYRSSVSSLSSSIGGGSAATSSGSSTMKRGGKKHNNWGNRERAGMSFLIVIAFFAIFGLIILTEVFMIDERAHGGMVMLRHGSGYGGRLGDSMPDYDNVKDDYDLLDENLLSDSKLGFVQFRDNKLKIQDAGTGDAASRLAGVLLGSVNGANGFPVGAPGARFAGGAEGLSVSGLSAAGLGGALAMVPWGKVLSEKDEKTLPPYPFGTQPTDGSWQVVNGTRFKFFVFSAYYDRRDGARLVRVVGATKTRGPERVWCRFWYRNNATTAQSERSRYTSATVMARVKVIRENWNLKYSACFVLCPVRLPELQVPQFVSVVARLRTPPGNLLQLRNTDYDPDFAVHHRESNATAGAALPRQPFRLPQGDQLADKIAICVKPFHFNYDQALYLMEYMEFYAILGVSHFTFYNHTIGPHASCVLQHYVDGDIPGNLTAYDETLANAAEAAAGIQPTASASGKTGAEPQHRHDGAHYTKPSVQILPWNLRMRSQKEIRTEGLFAALNDCLYRTMYRYKYLALVDLDEFIVPRQLDTLTELINSMNRRFRNRNTGAYSFQNAFFYLQFADDELVYQTTGAHDEDYARIRAALVTQRKIKRRFKLHPQKQRSKYICKPEAVVEAGNHFVWEFAPGRGSLNVPPTEAILQHYRVCEFGGNDCIKAPSVNDRTATKYVNRLVQRISAVYQYLKKRCDLPDLPPLPKHTDAELKQAQGVVKEPIEQKQTTAKRSVDQVPELVKQQPKKVLVKATNERLLKANSTVSVKLTATGAATTSLKSTSHNGQRNDSATANKATRELAAAPAATAAKAPPSTNVRKKRKFVVFDQDEEGLTVARLEYA